MQNVFQDFELGIARGRKRLVRTEVVSLLSLQPSQCWLFFSQGCSPEPRDEMHNPLASHPHFQTTSPPYKSSLE